jgi:hypothetical protein
VNQFTQGLSLYKNDKDTSNSGKKQTRLKQYYDLNKNNGDVIPNLYRFERPAQNNDPNPSNRGPDYLSDLQKVIEQMNKTPKIDFYICLTHDLFVLKKLPEYFTGNITLPVIISQEDTITTSQYIKDGTLADHKVSNYGYFKNDEKIDYKTSEHKNNLETLQSFYPHQYEDNNHFSNLHVNMNFFEKKIFSGKKFFRKFNFTCQPTLK